MRQLLAAYDLDGDRLYGHIKPRKRRGEFLTFLRYVRSLYPPQVRLGLVLDNRYVGFDDPDSPLLFAQPEGSQDVRLQAKEPVVGILSGGDAVAVVRAAVAENGVVLVTVGGRELVVWHQAGQASALDDDSVAGGQEIGSVAVFDPVVDGQRLTFTRREGGGFTDALTGSTWNVLGEATAGPLAGRRLEAHPSVDTFWFAWVAFQPDTRMIP